MNFSDFLWPSRKPKFDNEVVTTGNFTLQAQMPMGKTITVSGYIYANSTIESISKQVDLLHDVVDRQRTRAEIPQLELELEKRYEVLGQCKEASAQLVAKASSGVPLTTVEQGQVDSMDVQIKKVLADIEKGKEAIAEAKDKLK